MNGGRPLRSVGPSELVKALEHMNPYERTQAYLDVNSGRPNDQAEVKERKMFNNAFIKHYSDDVEKMAEAFTSPRWSETVDVDEALSRQGSSDPTGEWTDFKGINAERKKPKMVKKGGKTKRNRRSLKQKRSKRH